MSGAEITALVAAGTTLFGWLLKVALEKALSRSVGSQLEALKFDLQRQMLKAELVTTRVHDVYPKLLERLLKAQGAALALHGLQVEPSYEEHDDVDFRRVVRANRLLSGQAKTVLALVGDPKTRADGVAQLRQLIQLAKARNARVSLERAKNYRVLKRLFLSPVVAEHSIAIEDAIYNVILHCGGIVEGVRDLNAARQHSDVAKKFVADLENAMRAELEPVEQGLGAPG